MKLAATVKELVTMPVRIVPRRLRPPARPAQPPYWLAGQQRPGQASDFESWPPTAQDDPPGPDSPRRQPGAAAEKSLPNA